MPFYSEKMPADYRKQTRKATNSDVKDVQRLVSEVLKEYGLIPDPSVIDSDIADIEKAYLKAGGMFYVVEMDNMIIGCAGLFRIDELTCELRKMYIYPVFRGRGIGRFLLHQLISDAKRLGYRKVTLETASVLKEAINMYKANGFKPYSAGNICSRCDQAFMLELV